MRKRPVMGDVSETTITQQKIYRTQVFLQIVQIVVMRNFSFAEFLQKLRLRNSYSLCCLSKGNLFGNVQTQSQIQRRIFGAQTPFDILRDRNFHKTTIFDSDLKIKYSRFLLRV